MFRPVLVLIFSFKKRKSNKLSFSQVCQLERFGETSGLGISLEARAGHHYLCSVLPEGPIGQSGTIFTGDQILEVTD